MTLLYWAVFAAVAVYLALEVVLEVARRRRVRRDARETRRWFALIDAWAMELHYRKTLRQERDDRGKLAA